VSLLRVFISSSPDLRSYRTTVKDALLAWDITPVLQESFPADVRSVNEIIKHTIEASDAVILLIGSAYGAEPPVKVETRRSYWQIEVDIARSLKKPIFIFITDGDLSVGAQDEPPDKQALQHAYREDIQKSGLHYYRIRTAEDLVSQLGRIDWLIFAKQGRQTTGFRIFISYRHKDLAALCVAARLYERLVEAFGVDNIFMDIQNIPPRAGFPSSDPTRSVSSERIVCNYRYDMGLNAE
jgi:hypothetical protein